MMVTARRPGWRWLFRLVVSGLAVTGAFLASCDSATDITLQLSTDVPSASPRSLVIYAGPDESVLEGDPVATVGEWGVDGDLGSLVLAPKDGEDGSVFVAAVLGVNRPGARCRAVGYEGCIVARRRTRFLPGQSLTIPIVLHGRCVSIGCTNDTTCNAEGNCVGAELDPAACRDGGCLVQGDGARGAGGAGGAGGGDAGAAGAAGAAGGPTVPGPECPERCDEPPTPSCASGILTTFSTVGTCAEGQDRCEYLSTNFTCTTNCLDCLPDYEEACAGVVCDDPSGCSIAGFCGPGGECSFVPADDGSTCTQEDGESGFCLAGTCVEQCPNGAGCDDGDPCTEGDTCLDFECQGTLKSCADGKACVDGACVACTKDTDCDDRNDCTDDACGDSGECEFTPNTDPCDDRKLCTHSDRCRDGACVGTAISCNDESGTCGANRSCNGTDACSVTYPGSGTNCNDGNACTHSDRCNGAGQCTGTSITCSDAPGVCGANRSCNGTATCSVSYPGTGTGCSDGNACTSGDRCNGSGSCTPGSPRPDGHQWGGNANQRCCGGQPRNLSTDPNHCGGCGTRCGSGYSCEPLEGTSCSAGLTKLSGRCRCNHAIGNSTCPRGQVCRNPVYGFPDRCGPPSSATCAPGQSFVDLSGCSNYCRY